MIIYNFHIGLSIVSDHICRVSHGIAIPYSIMTTGRTLKIYICYIRRNSCPGPVQIYDFTGLDSEWVVSRKLTDPHLGWNTLF